VDGGFLVLFCLSFVPLFKWLILAMSCKSAMVLDILFVSLPEYVFLFVSLTCVGGWICY